MLSGGGKVGGKWLNENKKCTVDHEIFSSGNVITVLNISLGSTETNVHFQNKTLRLCDLFDFRNSKKYLMLLKDFLLPTERYFLKVSISLSQVFFFFNFRRGLGTN